MKLDGPDSSPCPYCQQECALQVSYHFSLDSSNIYPACIPLSPGNISNAIVLRVAFLSTDGTPRNLTGAIEPGVTAFNISARLVVEMSGPYSYSVRKVYPDIIWPHGLAAPTLTDPDVWYMIPIPFIFECDPGIACGGTSLRLGLDLYEEPNNLQFLTNNFCLVNSPPPAGLVRENLFESLEFRRVEVGGYDYLRPDNAASASTCCPNPSSVPGYCNAPS